MQESVSSPEVSMISIAQIQIMPDPVASRIAAYVAGLGSINTSPKNVS